MFRRERATTSLPLDGPASAREAFEGCPNRAMGKKQGSKALAVTCPKYPDSVELNYTSIDGPETREKVGQMLGCFGCKLNQVEFGEKQRAERIEKLHPAIVDECSGLFESEHYPEASMRGFMTVRGRLRELTGHEKATDAFGKGGLEVGGSPAEHLDGDFQQAAQFLMMSIDMFRNVSAHGGRIGEATGSETSFEFLTLSSLAMHLLDDATGNETAL